jgi:hypothetical protein
MARFARASLLLCALAVSSTSVVAVELGRHHKQEQALDLHDSILGSGGGVLFSCLGRSKGRSPSTSNCVKCVSGGGDRDRDCIYKNSTNFCRRCDGVSLGLSICRLLWSSVELHEFHASCSPAHYSHKPPSCPVFVARAQHTGGGPDGQRLCSAA